MTRPQTTLLSETFPPCRDLPPVRTPPWWWDSRWWRETRAGSSVTCPPSFGSCPGAGGLHAGWTPAAGSACPSPWRRRSGSGRGPPWARPRATSSSPPRRRSEWTHLRGRDQGERERECVTLLCGIESVFWQGRLWFRMLTAGWWRDQQLWPVLDVLDCVRLCVCLSVSRHLTVV